jgi:hypothetical protein
MKFIKNNMEKPRVESEPKIEFNIIDESKKGRIRLEGKNAKSSDLLWKYSSLLYDYKFLKQMPYGDSALGLVLPIKGKLPKNNEIFFWEEGSEHLAENTMWKEACNEAMQTINKIKEFIESESGAKEIELLHAEQEEANRQHDESLISLAQATIKASIGELPEELQRAKDHKK